MTGTVIWNIRIRLIHWAMAVIILLSLFVFDDGETVHQWLGYGALLFLFIRLIIGFFGSGYEAFKNFELKPARLIEFLKDHLRLKIGKNYLGHNPAASWSYIFFWLCVVGLGVTGVLLVHVDAYFGDERIEQIHELLSHFVQFFIVLHLSGLLLDSYIHKHRAWMAMITGKK